MNEETLKQKVEDALRRACAPDDKVKIALEGTAGDRVGGYVVSTKFQGQTPSQRQDLIWKELDEALGARERAQISFIITDTPEEHDSLAAEAS